MHSEFANHYYFCGLVLNAVMCGLDIENCNWTNNEQTCSLQVSDSVY